MQIYLPIAEMTISAESIFLLSAIVGFLSGMFGIGGGFLTTPILIFLGIPPAIAVGSQSSQLVASSTAGVFGHWYKGNVDLKVGVVMLVGGFMGSIAGIFIFQALQAMGQIDFAISLLYIILLGGIGFLMLFESVRSIFFPSKGMTAAFNTSRVSPLVAALPFKMRFPRSALYISVLVPGGLGFVGGMLASILGIGGGFLLVPAMIYILGMPVLLVAGTSLFQMIFTTAFSTILHASVNHNVDIVLAAILIVGGVLGAQTGVAFSGRIKGVHARLVLTVIILAVCFQLVGQMFIEPQELYSVEMVGVK